MKKLRQRLTLADVNHAINSLKEQSINPTADNILAEIIRSSNGTVGGSKGTVLKLKRQLESTDNSTNSSTVKSTSMVQYSTNKLNHSTETVLNSIDENLLSTLEVQLWSKLEARLDEKLRLSGAAKINLDGLEKKVTQLNNEVQRFSESEAQAAELHQVNERLALENNELKFKLEAIQHERLILNEEATNQLIQFQSILNQASNQVEAQQTQLNQLNQDLNSLHELWLEAISQTTTPSAAVSTTTETDPLESYFQVLTQLHSMTPTQKYDYAMRLFEQGLGPSEVSRILAVNKGSLQHYKEGKRKRPNNG